MVFSFPFNNLSMKPKFKILIVVVVLFSVVFYAGKMAFDAFFGETAQAQSNGLSAEVLPPDSQLEPPADNENLAKGKYTPESYIPLKYDPFSNKYHDQPAFVEPDPQVTKSDGKPTAAFNTMPKKEGFPTFDSATVGTTFTFNASESSDYETDSGKLEVRWDFDGDGRWDSYFSRVRMITHTYDKAGVYTVILEVLDNAGNTATTSKTVTIVENTAPTAYLLNSPDSGTSGTIFSFDTSKSYDSQYLKSYLQYRFDWDNDGNYDTPYEQKTQWRHKFDKSGTYHVVMQTLDPEGLTSTYCRDIVVYDNTPPVASFSVTLKQNPSVNGVTQPVIVTLDASSSGDRETPVGRLQFRWDFNYTGADDIVFDSNFSSSRKITGTYTIPGAKVVRLQVRDEDGAVTEAFMPVEI
jgi:hypothetical protein